MGRTASRAPIDGKIIPNLLSKYSERETKMEKRNYRIDNVELNWAKLAKPVSPFGTLQWELQIATEDKALAEELRANHFNVKEKDGKFVVSLKRKAVKSDGTDNTPVRVVNAQLAEIDANTLGNGSRGNVIVFQYPYETAGRSGVASSLSGVQVTELVEYTPGTGGFTAIDTGAEPAEDAPVF